MIRLVPTWNITPKDGVAEKFKAFCSEFDNQNAALDSLITAYEVQNAKAVLTDRKTSLIRKALQITPRP